MTDLAVLGIEVRSQQVVEAMRDLDALAASADRVSAAIGRLGQAGQGSGGVSRLVTTTREISTASDVVAASIAKTTAALDAERRSIEALANPWQKATSAVAQYTAGIDAAIAARVKLASLPAPSTMPPAPGAAPPLALPGNPALPGGALPTPQLPSPALPPAPLRPPAPAPTPSAGGVAPLRPDQLQNLTYQITDVFQSLALGMSPLTVLLQQGGQIANVFGPGQGGVTGVLSGVGQAIGKFITPLSVTAGSITAIGAAVAYAYSSFSDGQRRAEASLNGIGRMSGATVQQINAAAAEASKAPGGLSTSAARDVAATYAGTGRIGPEFLGDLSKLTKDFAATTRQEVPDAASFLAGALSDLSTGVDKLETKLPPLANGAGDMARKMAAAGDQAGALRVVIDALPATLVKAQSQMGGFSAEWDRIKTRIGNRFDAAGGALFGEPGTQLDRQLAAAEDRLRQIQASQARYGSRSNASLYAAELTAQQKAVDSLRAEADRVRSAPALDQANDRANIAGRIIKALNPEGAGISALEAEYSRIGKSLADSIAFPTTKIAGGIENAVASYSTLGQRLDVLRGQYEKGGEAAATALRQADYARATAGLNSYARGLAEINRQFDEQVIAAQKAAEAGKAAPTAGAINANRSAAIGAYRTEAEQEVVRNLNLPRDFGQTVIGIESRGSPYARNSLSTAAGLGGFTEGTFLEQFRKAYPARAEGMANASILSLRSDLETVTALIEQYAKETARRLEQAGLDASSRNLYLGHFLGPSGAVRALQADPSAKASDILGDAAARANPSIIGGGRTIGSVVDYAGRQVAKFDPQVQGVADSAKILDAQTAATDRSILSTERLAKVQELLSADRARGGELGRSFATAQDLVTASSEKLTPELQAQRRAILDVAGAYGSATQSASVARLRKDLVFEREQLGRSSTDAMINARLRGRVDINSPEGQDLAGVMRMNEALRETRSLSQDALSGFLTDLAHGASLTNSLTSLLSRMGDRLINSSVDKFLGGLFDAGGGSPTGGVSLPGAGGFLSTLGSSIGSLFGFADGGALAGRSGVLSGPGGPREDRILVRASPGEFIVNAAATARHSDLLHAINGGTPFAALASLTRFAAGGQIGFAAPTPEGGAAACFDVEIAA